MPKVARLPVATNFTTPEMRISEALVIAIQAAYPSPVEGLN
jgi:hypothetical protein